MMFVALLAACVPAQAPAIQPGCAQPAGSGQAERELLGWVNGERKARGLPPFRRSSDLDRAAGSHACDMATRNYFAHSRPGGPKLAARVKGAGYPMYRSGENLAWTRTLEVATTASIWRNSPSHWQTVIDPGLTEIGLAVAGSEGGRIYWVMDVAAPRWW